MKKSSAVLWPAMTLFVVSFLVLAIHDPLAYFNAGFLAVWLGSHLFSCLLGQVFAYITCWAFVLRRDKGYRQIWTNYIVWILILNLGTVASMLS